MNLSSSFQLLRKCAASSSSRALARPARFVQPRRYYSEQKPAESPKDESAAPEQEQTKKEEDKCSEKLKAKDAEAADLKGRLQYLHADFLNLQRNAAREKEQTRDFAITRFASDLLETVDVLAIALKSIPHGALVHPPPQGSSENASGDAASIPEGSSKSHATYLKELHTGVEMTHRLLLQTLVKYHVKPFDPTGEPFNPNHHEALYQAPVPGKEPGTVIDCQKTGYMIKDRVLRAAQVGVAQDTS